MPTIALRAPAETDRAALFAIIDDPSIARYFQGIPHPFTDANMDRLLANSAEVHRFVIEREADRTLLGMVNIHVGQPTGDYVSYWVGRSHRGRGIACRAVELLLDHAFETIGFDRLRVTVHLGNVPSERLVRRLGFVDLGRCDLAGRPGRLFEMTKRKWKRKI